MKTLLTIAAFFVLAVPAALAVPPAGHGNQGKQDDVGAGLSPSKQCKDQRHTMGMNAFRLLYAPGGSPKAAMDACLGKLSHVASTEAKNAAKACKAERESLGVQAFADKYGTNANKRNAFGTCVSMKAKQSADDHQQATLNAAKKCKAELQSLGAQAFGDKYGTNANKRNAFGKCVSKLASSKSDS